MKKKLDFFLAYFQYYINAKDLVPMDIEFVIQDTYSALRPQWKIILNDMQEAGRVFSEAVKQNYHDASLSKTPEPEEVETQDLEPEDSDGEDAVGEGERPLPNSDTADLKSDPDDIPDEAADGAVNSSSDESETHRCHQAGGATRP